MTRCGLRVLLSSFLGATLSFAIAPRPACGQVADPCQDVPLTPRNKLSTTSNDRICTSSYTIDLHQGPVLAGSRVVGLAGAYAPIDEGIAGYSYNPAAAAVRTPWSVDFVDWELDAGVTLPSSIVDTDFDNNGDGKFTNSAGIFLTGGLGLQFARLGVGLTLDYSSYDVNSREDTTKKLRVSIVEPLLVAAYAFWRGQLVVGAGVGLHAVSVTEPEKSFGEGDKELASVTGSSLRLGVLWAPHRLPLRASLSVRGSPVDPNAVPSGAEKIEGSAGGASYVNYVAAGYYLPKTITLPTEIHAGVAVQLFRPMNLPWVNPRTDPNSQARKVEKEIAEARKKRREEVKQTALSMRSEGKDPASFEKQAAEEEDRATAEDEKKRKAAKAADRESHLRPYREMPRRKLLMSAAVKITSRTENGIGLDSFLGQKVERSGEEWSFSPRLGLEAEVIPEYLTLRGGSYYEPTRFATGQPRVHGTFGLDVHVPLPWTLFGLVDKGTLFRISGALDGTYQYFGWTVGAGLWH